ncbi:phosphotransferase [Deinococcus aquiradiocola]|uniref:Aminoglycoside phosphotransferase n=1 Tax=Deinococcus aquiradiocola TaxID=393059 RepID=A0A917P7S5_9DEIO|nr:phosphotransferase [Deinococcus aquiradiocola]GGJ65854.1 aminoglycoside phosphotransferase [Deinococcus aquiradiocola]
MGAVPDGPDHPQLPLFPTLEARYGPLVPADAGMQSRVYRAGDLVLKVYRRRRGEHLLEADNMRRAGMGDRVADALEADGVEVLVMRHFPGHPLREADVLPALPQLRDALTRLHAIRSGRVDLLKLRERLKRFRSALAPYPLEDLFEAVEGPLEHGALDVPASFCHLDLWQDNILVSEGGEVLVIDWTRAGFDDPLRDIALLKTGTLDMLPRQQSLDAALGMLPDRAPDTLLRFRAYLAHTCLHDLYWFLMNEPYAFEGQRDVKLPRARHALEHLAPHP